jgi:hypothetical protein
MHQYWNYCFPTQLCVCTHTNTHRVASPESHKQQHADSTICPSSVEFEKQTLHKGQFPEIKAHQQETWHKGAARDLIVSSLGDKERGDREELCLCISVDGSFAKCRIWESTLPFPSISITNEKAIPCKTAAWEESCSCLSSSSSQPSSFLAPFYKMVLVFNSMDFPSL